MTNIINFLKGKKTYIVAFIGLIYGLTIGDFKIIEISLLGLTGRAAIAKIQ